MPPPPTPSKLPPPPPFTLQPRQSAVAPAGSKIQPIEEDAEAHADDEPKTPPAPHAKLQKADANADQRKNVFTALKERKARQEGDEIKKDGLNPVTPPTVAKQKRADTKDERGFNTKMITQRRGALGDSPKKPADSDDDSF